MKCELCNQKDAETAIQVDRDGGKGIFENSEIAAREVMSAGLW